MKKGTIIYETNEDQKAGPDDIDGMEEMLGDDILDTDWDIECENPPHAHLAGLDLHGKQGKR